MTPGPVCQAGLAYCVEHQLPPPFQVTDELHVPGVEVE